MNLELTLTRTYFPKGTNGVIFNGEKFLCRSIELPWNNNKPGASCIPEGRYEMVKRYSAKHGNHILIKENFPDRDLILIHKANDALKELRGCIAPVKHLTGQGLGSESKAAFDPLITLIYGAIDSGNKAYLNIKKA
jgi:hypothetical protein